MPPNLFFTPKNITMTQNLPSAVRCLLYCLTLTIVQFTNAQTLNPPELSFSYACVSESFNNFDAIISYETNPFNSDNVFYLELSDASGSFSSPEIVKTISGENYSFDFETSFSFPMNVSGQNYKLRVRSTSPEKVSPSTTAFNAYFIPNANLILNNYEDVSICGGSSATISLNVDVANSYLWYKNGDFYQEGGNSLTVTSSGEYYAAAFYGDCTGELYSNIVIVNFGEEINASIEGNSIVEACPGTIHTLKATTDNEFLDYKWFKNNQELTNLPSYFPELEIEVSDATYGIYKLALVNEGGCEAISQEIEVKAPNTNTTTVNADSPLENVLLGENSVTLKISTSTSNPRVSWYKNDELIANGVSLELPVSEAGTYYAKVSAPGSCLGVVDSPIFKVFDPVSFTAIIDYDENYVSCQSSDARIDIKSISAIAVNGSEHIIIPALYNRFNINWMRDNATINETGSSYIVENYLENGIFSFSASFNDINFSSNELAIKLAVPSITLNTDSEMICSTNGQAILTVAAYENALYNWYKEDELLERNSSNIFVATESGEYRVEIALNDCFSVSNHIVIRPFGEDIIAVFPSEKIFISSNSSEIVSAVGGDSYAWKNTDGLIVSSSDSFDVSEPGTYYLIATKDGCEVTKEITVELLEVVEVPNIITPNQDNINDKWVLPAKFLNDPSVEVTICDTYGKPVLKTKAYQNNWPENSLTDRDEASIYYYFIQKDGRAIKKGSITVVNR